MDSSLPHQRRPHIRPQLTRARPTLNTAVAMASARRSTARVASLLLLAAALTCSWSAGRTFVAPGAQAAAKAPSAGSAASEAKVQSRAVTGLGGAAAVSGIAERVRYLREASLEACMLATEDNSASIERCSELAYELSNAEKVLRMRQDTFTYGVLDSDSY
mmetsp:Transcript_112179/g.281136  ORF Transcript_112179/g.281136 Transcript_112179/m.281136 type:complete len:161 (+) Transcript_112179:3-485(+)